MEAFKTALTSINQLSRLNVWTAPETINYVNIYSTFKFNEFYVLINKHCCYSHLEFANSLLTYDFLDQLM